MMKADVAGRRLDIDLDGRHAFGLAQGMLAEMAGCSAARAGAVLLQVGAQLGFDSADSIAEFFLASATADPAGKDTLAFTRSAATATSRARGDGLKWSGELDVATAPLLAAAWADPEPAAWPGHPLLFDLHDLTFVDAAGLRVLAEIHTRLRGLGYDLRLAPPSDAFTRWTMQFAVRSGWLPPMFGGGLTLDTAPIPTTCSSAAGRRSPGLPG
jgi:anti-anti-sigma factor